MPGGLEILIEPKIRTILKTLQKSPSELFNLNSLADSSHVPVSSTARIIRKLVKNNFVEELKIGKWSVYKLVSDRKIEDKDHLDLIDPKIKKILFTLQKTPDKINHLNSLADSSHVPVSSTARIIRKLVKNNFVEELKIGKWSVYRLAENKQTEVLKEL